MTTFQLSNEHPFFEQMIFIDDLLRKDLDGYLDRDERLLWVGKPKLGIRFQFIDIFLIPFSALWFGFAVFWVTMASQGSITFSLFGIPFVFVGFYMLIGRFFVDKRKRDNTVYGVTAKRILIKTGKNKVSVQSFPITDQLQIDLLETSDGRGSITIGSTVDTIVTGQFNQLNQFPNREKTLPMLDQIADARTVFNQILKLQKENNANS